MPAPVKPRPAPSWKQGSGSAPSQPTPGGWSAFDLGSLLGYVARPFSRLCPVPDDLEPITRIGDEVPAAEVGASDAAVGEIWRAVESLYRTGLYPAVQVCVRRDGARVFHRALGYARGNEPGSPPEARRVPIELETPFCLYSASKAVTAMVIHKLDEERVLHIDDRVCDYIPEFGIDGKQWITIRHVLGHRAGIPRMPPDSMNLDLLEHPEEVVRIMCEAPRLTRPGQRLAYHAVTGGFLLGEVVRRATGADIRAAQRRILCEPLGLRWMNYGVAEEDLDCVARDAVTGLPLAPPLDSLFQNVLGTSFASAVGLATDPRFLRGIIPSANVCATAEELSLFYQCLLDEGELRGVRVFDPRTVRRATSEQAYGEIDLTLILPLRHSLGFMLGGEWVGLWGLRTPRAFGHVGLTNIFAWADPDRRLAAAIVTSGKPVLDPGVLALAEVIYRIGEAFPPLARDSAPRP